MRIELKTLGIIFTFDVKLKDNSKRSKFYRELYGWKDYSYYGEYTYIKEGLLSEIKHIKPTKSTIIVSIEDSKKLRDYFKKFNIDFDERIIFLNQRDAKKLGISYTENLSKIYQEIKKNQNLVFNADF